MLLRLRFLPNALAQIVEFTSEKTHQVVMRHNADQPILVVDDRQPAHAMVAHFQSGVEDARILRERPNCPGHDLFHRRLHRERRHIEMQYVRNTEANRYSQNPAERRQERDCAGLSPIARRSLAGCAFQEGSFSFSSTRTGHPFVQFSDSRRCLTRIRTTGMRDSRPGGSKRTQEET